MPKEVIGRLDAVEVAHGLKGLDLPLAEVGAPNEANLALGDKFAKCYSNLCHWPCGVWPVDQIEINVVGAQRAQARFQSFTQPGSTGIADKLIASLPQATPCGQHQLLSLATHLWLERLVKELLCNSKAIGLCSVKEIDAKVKCCAHGRLVGAYILCAPLAPKGPRPKADFRHAHTGVAERSILHCHDFLSPLQERAMVRGCRC